MKHEQIEQREYDKHIQDSGEAISNDDSAYAESLESIFQEEWEHNTQEKMEEG